MFRRVDCRQRLLSRLTLPAVVFLCWSCTTRSYNPAVPRAAAQLKNQKSNENTDYKTKGDFQRGPNSRALGILSDYEAYLQDQAAAESRKVEAVTRADADTLFPFEEENLPALLSSFSQSASDRCMEATQKMNCSSLYYMTSGAGLWTRGGGQIKALLPVNFADLIDDPKVLQLLRENTQVPKLPGQSTTFSGMNDTTLSQTLKEFLMPLTKKDVSKPENRRAVEAIVSAMKQSNKRLNALDVKFLQIATLSLASRNYIQFDIWTSAQTHKAIYTYVTDPGQMLSHLKGHANPLVRELATRALEPYLEVSKELGETHIFGYQRGFFAIDQYGVMEAALDDTYTKLHMKEVGRPTAKGRAIPHKFVLPPYTQDDNAAPGDESYLSGLAPLGEGAGMAIPYLRETGRLKTLKERGADSFVFQNIEVFSPLASENLTWKTMRDDPNDPKQMGIVVVELLPGYSGGAPFKVDGDIQLIETSALDEAKKEELEKKQVYFNTNTMYQDFDLELPALKGFEGKNATAPKVLRDRESPLRPDEFSTSVSPEDAQKALEFLKQGQMYIKRIKVNAGDYTLLPNQKAGIIAGQAPAYYENFKSYGEYLKQGSKVVQLVLDRLEIVKNRSSL